MSDQSSCWSDGWLGAGGQEQFLSLAQTVSGHPAQPGAEARCHLMAVSPQYILLVGAWICLPAENSPVARSISWRQTHHARWPLQYCPRASSRLLAGELSTVRTGFCGMGSTQLSITETFPGVAFASLAKRREESLPEC